MAFVKAGKSARANQLDVSEGHRSFEMCFWTNYRSANSVIFLMFYTFIHLISCMSS